jgi:hypothetical protein
MEEPQLFGKLFNTVPLLTQDHLNVLLETMDKDNANYLLIQAVNHAYRSGVYTLGESEVISKAIRIISHNEIVTENGED